MFKRAGREATARWFLRVPLQLAGAFVALSSIVAAQTPMESFPKHHVTRTAEVPQLRATFGYTAAAGKIEGLLDDKDDVVSCAIGEDQTSPTVLGNVGAAYIFLDEELVPPTDPNARRLTPLNPEANQTLGSLGVVIGNIRGSGATNLIMLGAPGTTASYCSAAEDVLEAGSVEVYDFNDSNFAGLPLLSLQPPLNAGSGSCASLVPHDVRHFGTALAVSDVTRDGVADLIVGAPESSVGSEVGLGRIYVFRGHEDFLDEPYDAWIGLNAPEHSPPSEPEDPEIHGGIGFGHSIVTARVTEASLHDVVVGRHDRFALASKWEEADQPQGGSAVVIRGKYLHDLFGGSTLNAVSDPVFSDELDQDVPEYQILPNPFGELQAPIPFRAWEDWFGWIVFAVGDVGCPEGDEFDGIDDIIVHSEDADYIGTGDVDSPEISKVGGAFVYYGTGDENGPYLVHPEHLLLQTPLNAGGPEQKARFSRALARIELLNPALSTETIPVVQPALLISDIDRTVGTHTHAGQVYLIRLPLPAPPADPWVHADIENAWGSSALTEPGGAGGSNYFGSWILALDYWGNQSEQPGQQFVVTSRGSPVVYQSSSVSSAGKFYSFTPKEP